MPEYNKSICRSCFHSYVCEEFNADRDSNNKKCHYFNDHYVSAADVVEVVHGEWVPLEYDGYADGNPVWDLWECSQCREEHSGDEDTLTPYCPNCGADMRRDTSG